MTTDRKAQLGVSVDTTNAEHGFAKISAEAKNMADNVRQAGEDAKGGLDGMGKGADVPAEKIDKATSKIIASIQRATAAAEAAGKSGSAYYESLATQRGANLDVLKPYLAQLDEVTQKQVAAKIAMAQGTDTMDRLGMSAKATAAAMRGVPAQFTDIVVSLQGGQKPMTVLLQQGGQLKDMFGGIGNAASALSTYVIGLINPMTMLAAVAGTVGYAYYKGSQESDAYAKSLILSGNAAGTTAGQLSAMAANIAKATGTQGAAAEALAQMAQSGKVGADNLESFTRSAIRFESVGGAAVSEVVKQFIELAKSPTEASLKLNETYNHLTASVYRQIKALEDQGKATEAANLAQKVLSDTMDIKSAQMVGQIGTIEAAWKELTKVIKGAGDALLNIGRVQSPAQQLTEVRAKIASSEGRDKNKQFAMPWDTSLTDLRIQEASLQEMIRLERRGADAAAERAKQTAAVAEWDKTGAKYLTDKVKMEQEISAARTIGLAAGESQIAIEQRVKAIRESYVKKGAGKEGDPFAADREFAKQYAKSWEDFTKIGDEATGKTDNLSKAQEHLLEYLKSPAYGAHTEAMREIVLQAAYGAIASEKLAAEKKKEAAAMKESADAAFANSDAIYKSMIAAEDKLRTQQQENETIGLTTVQIAQLAKARDLEAAAALDAKAALYEQSGAREEDIDNIKRTAEALRSLASARLESAVKKQEQSDWMSFFSSIDSAAHQVWSNVLQGGQDIWSKLKNTAKTVFFDWLYQMTLKKWIFSIGATVSGSGAMAQTAAAGGVTGAGMAGAAGGAGAGVFMASSASSWFNDFGGSIGSAINSAGGKLFNAGFESIGGSLIDFGSDVSSVSDSINTFGEGLGYLNAAMAASKGEWGKAVGSAIGTYFGGPIGAAIGSAIGSWVDKSFGGGTKPSTEGGYTSGGIANPGTNGRAYSAAGYYGGAIDASAKGIVDDVTSTYTTIVKSLGGKAGTLTAQAFLGFDGNGGSKGSQNALDFGAQLNGQSIYNRFADLGTNAAGMSKEEMTAAAKLATEKSVLEALKATDLGPALNQYLASVATQGKSLEQIDAVLSDVSGFATFTAGVKSLPFDYLKNISVETAKAIAAAAGGIDQFGTALSNYFDLFSTAAEKQTAQTAALASGFDAIGSVMPKSIDGLREWYKSEVTRLGALDLSIEANAKAYAGALKLASGVDALVKAEEAAAQTRQSWQDQLSVLTGKTTDTAIQLQRDLASTTDESTKALIRAVYAEKDRQKAASDAASAAQKLMADQTAAAQKAADAYKSALSAQQSYYQSLISAGDSVRNLLASLKTGTNAATSPQSRLDAARAQYLQDLSAARGGDYAAYSRVATTAQTYIGAGSDMYASSADQKAIIAQIQSELANLPAVSQYDANLAALQSIEAAIKTGTASTVDAIQSQQFDTLAAITSMTATLSTGFANIDANANGMLTFDELKAGLNVGDTLTQQLINAIDTNGDGQISKLEIIAANTYGLDTLARINSTVNSINWTDKAAAVAQFSPIAQANGWTLQQIAAATGYNLTDIEALFAGTSISRGLRSSSTSNAATARATGASTISAGPSDAAYGGSSYSGLSDTRAANIVAAVNAQDWTDKNAAASTLWNQAYYLGWTEQDIAASLGYNLTDIDALFRNAGLPSFDVGTNYIPHDMLAQVHKGEAIVPERFNPAAHFGGAGQGDNQALIDEVRELRKEVAKARDADMPIHVTVMTHDGKKLAEQVISTIRERSRNKEVVIYAGGVGAPTR